MPTHRDLPSLTAKALMDTCNLLLRHGIEVEVHQQFGSSLVQSARNKCAHLFLESDFKRLFWIDSDMYWEPESFMRLLALSTEYEVIGASYPMKLDPIKFVITGPKPGDVVEANRFGCIQVDGMGIGFTCVQRKVIEELADLAPTTLLPDVKASKVAEIFRCESIVSELSKERGADGEFRGEDMTFFADVREKLGYKVWLDPSIKLGHIGHKMFEGSFSEILERTNGSD